jgi:transposase InsO family protein
MSLKREFVELARQAGANRRSLCARFGISPKTGYKWLRRFEAEGADGLEEHSRRPISSPGRCPETTERAVVAVRSAHPTWGGRKISRRLADLGQATVAPSTATGILRRHQLLGERDAAGHAWQRFEHAEPNQLWQIDFKGHFPTPAGPCHPLTLLDDHSRFNLLLHACYQTDAKTVQPLLIAAFRRYGLPVRINADNGAPWGSPRESRHGLSRLSVWLIRLGIRISHSRPAHPQTNGKDERFHRTLKAEVLNGKSFADHPDVQAAFDGWRTIYNCERPHDALGLAVPASRYRPSPIVYPEVLPGIEYGPDDQVREVRCNGEVRFARRKLKVSKALIGLPIAFRTTATDGVFDVFFCHHRVMRLDLNQPQDTGNHAI